MSTNFRAPQDLDEQLTAIAAEEHTSKNALLIEGARLVVERRARRKEIDAGLAFVMSHDAELLTRLEDA